MQPGYAVSISAIRCTRQIDVCLRCSEIARKSTIAILETEPCSSDAVNGIDFLAWQRGSGINASGTHGQGDAKRKFGEWGRELLQLVSEFGNRLRRVRRIDRDENDEGPRPLDVLEELVPKPLPLVCALDEARNVRHHERAEVGEVDDALCDCLDLMRPFGQDNASPVFAARASGNPCSRA